MNRCTWRSTHRFAGAAVLLATGFSARIAFAGPPQDLDDSAAAPGEPAVAPAAPAPDVAPRVPTSDPTGGAYTTPTLLFTPAAAVPVWNVRVITSIDVQGPTPADRLAAGTSVGFQPGIGGELGLPLGLTLAAGTQWVGGDTNPAPLSDGISPYFQLRLHVFGNADGLGVQLGTSLTYKFVGFDGDPGEMELAFSAQYRRTRYELGIQAVLGKDFATTDADSEIHAYALYRIVPQFGIGAAGQVRIALVWQPGESTYDVVAGPIASLTLGRWQVGALGGATTVGLNQGQVGALGELFATVRF